MWNITTKINFSQPGGVNVILQTVRQIDATQNKAIPDDPYARLFKAAPSCYLWSPNLMQKKINRKELKHRSPGILHF